MRRGKLRDAHPDDIAVLNARVVGKHGKDIVLDMVIFRDDDANGSAISYRR